MEFNQENEMMFVKLTSLADTKVYVNMNRVSNFFTIEDQTYLYMVDDRQHVFVKESSEAIMNMMTIRAVPFRESDL